MSSAKHDCAKSDKGPPCCAYDTQSRRQTCSYTAVTEQPIETPFQPTALRRFIDEFSVADRVWAVASNFHFAITEVILPLPHGRIWRGREILAPEFLKRLFGRQILFLSSIVRLIVFLPSISQSPHKRMIHHVDPLPKHAPLSS